MLIIIQVESMSQWNSLKDLCDLKAPLKSLEHMWT